MGVRLAKVKVELEVFKQLLALPEDTKITSIYTKRPSSRGPRETIAEVYIECSRFRMVNEGDVAPEMDMEEVFSIGLWDKNENK